MPDKEKGDSELAQSKGAMRSEWEKSFEKPKRRRGSKIKQLQIRFRDTFT